MVARMKRSGMRGRSCRVAPIPDFASLHPGYALTCHDHVEDRGLAALRGGERFLQRALELGKLLDALAVEAEMAAQSLVVRSLDRDAEMQVFAGRGAIGIVMHVALSHRLVFLVVENHDHDRQAVTLGRAERLHNGVVEERAVADEQRHRALRRRELDPERGADALPEAT